MTVPEHLSSNDRAHVDQLCQWSLAYWARENMNVLVEGRAAPPETCDAVTSGAAGRVSETVRAPMPLHTVWQWSAPAFRLYA